MRVRITRVSDPHRRKPVDRSGPRVSELPAGAYRSSGTIRGPTDSGLSSVGVTAYPQGMTLPAGQESGTITTAQGTLQFIVDASARSDDPLLVYHHGTPVAGPISANLLAAARAGGFRTVELVRPGYGSSTRTAGRTVADNAHLTRLLVNDMGAERFISVGWSGGGPHTLADVALLPNCMASLCIAGVGPSDAPDLDFLAGMGQDNLDEFAAALDPNLLEAYLTTAASVLGGGDGDAVKQGMASLLPAADLAYLTDALAAELAAQMDWSVTPGIWGWFDDDLAFTRPWGFDLGSIRRPVTVLQGSEDLMVPFAHGRWLAANIPGAATQLTPGEGHLSVTARHLTSTLTALRGHLNGGQGHA